MTNEEIQVKYDILQTAIFATLNIAVMVVSSILIESMDYAGLIKAFSTAAIGFIMAYLWLASLFISACTDSQNPWVSALNIAAKTCQWLFMLISFVVIVLFLIT